ncbi:hypothetical protein KUTeg_014568 [Tegillarca granosa]|uniref:Uncharacterized protein n=1 Tax=Tegillarca granosa TaxID=220873 RepID=A0ABQ9ERU1_TEGGR|nr:hypothetical protein KUTeg_014568 [Tegillarca granosa]
MDICESSVTFIYSLCPEAQMFSMNGSLSLIFSSSNVSGSTTTYTTFLYNNDPVTPDGTTYYTFVCMLFAITTNAPGIQISLSVNPTVCLSASEQTSTYVTGSSGKNITLTNLGTQVVPCCNEKDDIPDDDEHDNEQNKDNDSKMDIIIGLLIGCGVVLVLKIAVFIWIMRTRKRNK